jgi:ankyrin repeat protein
VEKNNYEITNLLLDQGADPTSGDKRGLTVLHYAARLGYVEIVKLLIKYGADINLRDGNGFNAAHWAKMN